MSRCFTRFLMSGLGEPYLYHNLEDFTIFGEDCGGLSDCEELVGVTHRGMMGFVSLGFRKFKSRSSKNTPEML